MSESMDKREAESNARQAWLDSLVVGSDVAVSESRGGYRLAMVAEIKSARFKVQRFLVGQTWFDHRGNSAAYHNIEPITDKVREAIKHQNALRCVQASIALLNDNRNHLAKTDTTSLVAAEAALRKAIDLLGVKP